MDAGPTAPLARCVWQRIGLAIFGWTMVAVGVVGIVVPGLPTTVFLVAAAWAFSRSSRRFHLWLWEHPRLGPPLRAWHRERAIPRGAKLAACLSMAVSFAVIAAVAGGWLMPLTAAAAMTPIAVWIVARPVPRF